MNIFLVPVSIEMRSLLCIRFHVLLNFTFAAMKKSINKNFERVFLKISTPYIIKFYFPGQETFNVLQKKTCKLFKSLLCFFSDLKHHQVVMSFCSFQISCKLHNFKDFSTWVIKTFQGIKCPVQRQLVTGDNS